MWRTQLIWPLVSRLKPKIFSFAFNLQIKGEMASCSNDPDKLTFLLLQPLHVKRISDFEWLGEKKNPQLWTGQIPLSQEKSPSSIYFEHWWQKSVTKPSVCLATQPKSREGSSSIIPLDSLFDSQPDERLDRRLRSACYAFLISWYITNLELVSM